MSGQSSKSKHILKSAAVIVALIIGAGLGTARHFSEPTISPSQVDMEAAPDRARALERPVAPLTAQPPADNHTELTAPGMRSPHETTEPPFADAAASGEPHSISDEFPPPPVADSGELANDEQQIEATYTARTATWAEYGEQSLAAFDAEVSDPEWSVNAAYVIETAAASVEHDILAVQEIECRSTMCRLEVSYHGVEGINSLDAFLSGTLSQIFPKVDRHPFREANGDSHMMVFLVSEEQ